jgi:hypothetical protein
MLGVSDQRFSVPGYRNLPEDLKSKLADETNITQTFWFALSLVPDRARCSWSVSNQPNM